jgi:hypothetical protein
MNPGPNTKDTPTKFLFIPQINVLSKYLNYYLWNYFPTTVGNSQFNLQSPG